MWHFKLVLGTSVNFSSSSEPSEKIFEPSRARAISQEMIFEPSRARAEKASSAFEREQNRASINHFSSMIFRSISSIVERKSSGNRAKTERKSSINQKPVQFSSKNTIDFFENIPHIYEKNLDQVKSIKKCKMSLRSKKHKIFNVNSDDVQFSSICMCIFNPG